MGSSGREDAALWGLIEFPPGQFPVTNDAIPLAGLGYWQILRVYVWSGSTTSAQNIKKCRSTANWGRQSETKVKRFEFERQIHCTEWIFSTLKPAWFKGKAFVVWDLGNLWGVQVPKSLCSFRQKLWHRPQMSPRQLGAFPRSRYTAKYRFEFGGDHCTNTGPLVSGVEHQTLASVTGTFNESAWVFLKHMHHLYTFTIRKIQPRTKQFRSKRDNYIHRRTTRKFAQLCLVSLFTVSRYPVIPIQITCFAFCCYPPKEDTRDAFQFGSIKAVVEASSTLDATREAKQNRIRKPH